MTLLKSKSCSFSYLIEADAIISETNLSATSLGSMSNDPIWDVHGASDTDNEATVAATWDDIETIDENLCPRLAILAFLVARRDCCRSRSAAMSSLESELLEFFLLDSVPLSKLPWLDIVLTLPVPYNFLLKNKSVISCCHLQYSCFYVQLVSCKQIKVKLMISCTSKITKDYFGSKTNTYGIQSIFTVHFDLNRNLIIWSVFNRNTELRVSRSETFH